MDINGLLEEAQSKMDGKVDMDLKAPYLMEFCPQHGLPPWKPAQKFRIIKSFLR